MNALYKITLSLLLAITVVSCGGKVDEEATQLIDNGSWKAALKLLNKAYKDSPDDPVVNGLLAEVKTQNCLKTGCAENNEGQRKLTEIREHLSNYAYEQGKNPEKYTRPVFKNMMTLITRQVVKKENPLILKNFTSYGIPQNIPKEQLAETLFDYASHALKTGSESLSRAFIKIASDNALPNSAEQISGKFLMALIDGRVKTAKSLATRINVKLNVGQAPKTFFKNLPYAVLYYALKKDELKGASLYLKSFTKLTKEVGLKHLAQGANAKDLANSFNAAAKSRSFVNLVRNKLDASEWWESESVRLALTRISLSLNYDFQLLWDRYIKTLLHTDEQPDDFLRMYDGIDLTKLKAEQIIKNNEQLLAHAESKLLKGDVLVALFQQILYRPDSTPEVFNKRVVALLSERVAHALEALEYEDLMAYLEFDKELIKGKREEFIKVFKGGIDAAWDKEDFKRIPILNNLITKTLGVKYNLDKDLIVRFEKAFDDPEVQLFYNADMLSDFHEFPEKVERTNNPKVAYVLEHFSKRPELIQRLLKKVSVEQPSTYGPAMFVLRMYGFFPKNERLSLVENALRSGLRKDEESTAIEVLEQGRELIKFYKGIKLKFIINESVKRLETLEEYQEYWDILEPAGKQIVKKAFPQNHSLMRALEEYDNGKVRDAMNRLKGISNKELLKLAEPYFKEFAKLFKPFYGSYVFADADNEMRAFKVTLSKSPINLKVNLSFETLIGTVFTEENFKKDWNQKSFYTITADADPKDFKLTLGYASRIQEKKEFSFERSFGFIEYLRINDDGTLNARLDDGKTYIGKRYRKEDEKDSIATTYKVTNVKEQTHFEDAAYILPVDSSFTFKKAKNSAEDDRIYKVTIKKPHHKNDFSALVNLDTNGYFNFSYNYMYKKIAYTAQASCQLAGDYINCGTHNKHWNTDLYHHRILLKSVK